MPKVSIIVPVYNASKYLIQCLDSLSNQTIGDVEIICVDDGSTDDSAQVITRYKDTHHNVRLIRQENSGAGQARNAGLAVATGRYISFCDPDDYYESDMLEKTITAMEKERADIGIVRWKRFEDTTGSWLPPSPFPARIRQMIRNGQMSFEPAEYASSLFNIVGHSVCDKIFTREHIKQNDIQFQPLRRTNDLFFSTMALATARRIAVVDEDLYCYRKGIKSTTTQDEYAGMFCIGCAELKKRLLQLGTFELFKESFVRMVVGSAKFDILSISNYSILKRRYAYIRKNVLELTRGWDFGKNPPGGSLDIVNYYEKLKFNAKPMPRAKVTTIITTYNHVEYIAKAIDSVVMQRGIDHEIIISDDASTDGTDKIVQQYASLYPTLIKDISSRTNLGISGNLQKCIAAATGTYVAVLEGDDYWTAQEKLWRQSEFLRDNPDCSMVFSRISAISMNRQTPRTYKVQDNLPMKISGEEMFVNGRCGGVCMNFSTCMYRRNLLINLPPVLFESRLSELSLSFYMEKKGPLGYISTPLSVYRDFGLGTWTSANMFEQFLQRVKCREQAKAVCSKELVPLVEADIRTCCKEFNEYFKSVISDASKLPESQKKRREFLKQIEAKDRELKNQVHELEFSQRRRREFWKQIEANCLQIEKQSALIHKLEREVEALRTSESYRFGLFVTSWPRALARWFRSHKRGMVAN